MKHGEVRIIGGKWRSRKLRFPAIPGLRPTADRNRETLFNWLAPTIQDAHCLDLFAGSGALGFEALSRGASYNLFIDSSPEVAHYLQEQLKIFNVESTQAEVFLNKIPAHLPTKFSQKKFDIVFLDPPFHKNFIAPCCQWLIENNLLAEKASIYIETESTLQLLPIPETWEILQHKKSGHVAYYLVTSP